MVNSINTNIAAYYAQSNISKANSMSSSSIARLSSGNRIARASDDVAAMAVGTSLKSTVNALKVGLSNASQGSSLLQVADGALGKISDMLLRQKALATQAASGSMTAANRSFLNQEFQNLGDQINQITQTTNFNGVNLLGGGLGTKFNLLSTDAIVASGFLTTSATNTDTSGAATLAIQAINKTSGAVIAAAAATNIALVDSANADLVNGAYLNVNSAVSGGIEKIAFSDVNFGAGAAGNATLTVTMNGVDFTGTVAGGATTLYVQNGTTRLELTLAAATSFANQLATDNTLNAMYDDFQDTIMLHTGSVSGVSFNGTALTGVEGAAGTGVAVIRTASPGNVDVGNFQFVSRPSANNTTLTVEVNGETWTAAGVTDAITAASVLIFEKGNGEALMINFAGMDASSNLALGTNPEDRTTLVNSLNAAFSKAGSGVDFALGPTSAESLRVQIASASTNSLYGGQSLDISTAAGAETAGDALNTAIDTVTAIRANVGALMSRFDYASANLEIAVQNQDAARGTLVDTDISAESTAYATYQVQLQAGISVLAQANQLGQNFLKLLG